ncbi:MAG: vWA domain-containing protein [Phycisphaerae bacterium]
MLALCASAWWGVVQQYGGVLLAALSVTLIWLVVVRYPVPKSAVSGGARLWMAALRLLALAGLLFLLGRPVLTHHTVRYERPRLTVCLDQSRSLETRDVLDDDASGLQRRHDAMRATFERTAVGRKRLATMFDVELLGFDAEARPKADWSVAPVGNATALGAVLDRIRPSAGSAGQVVLLVSDGAENVMSRDAVVRTARRLAGDRVAVISVGVGSDEPIGDTRRLMVRRLEAPERAAVHDDVAVQAEAAAYGFANVPLLAELLWDGQVVADQELTPSESRFHKPIQFNHVAQAAGFHRVAVRLREARPASRTQDDPIGGPRTSIDQAQFVHVVRDRIQVLVVASQPRHELAFLLRSLAGDSRLSVRPVMISRPVEGPWENPLPRTAAQWGQFDVVILDDVPRRKISRERLQALADAVTQQGVALLAVGGSQR